MPPTKHLHDCLSRLATHLDRRRVALTGGLAIGLHAAARGEQRWCAGGPEGDVDCVAAHPEAVYPTVTEGFLVSHFHLPQPGYPKFLIQLVDPSSRLRVDVFPDTLGALPRARPRVVAGVEMLVVEPCDILEHKLATLASASGERPVEEKHFRDAVLLGAWCHRAVPAVPASYLSQASYSQDLAAACDRCETSRSALFPLASKAEILGILGYV